MTEQAAEHAGVDGLLAAARDRYERVEAADAYDEICSGTAVLVDTRPEAQRRAEGAIAPEIGALLIERNVLEWRFDPRQEARVAEASFDARVIVLCQEGYASSLAADALRSIGIRRATDVVGGFAAWRRAGLPVA